MCHYEKNVDRIVNEWFKFSEVSTDSKLKEKLSRKILFLLS